MNVRIKAYGIARDITKGETEVACDGNTVGDLRNTLMVKYPALGELKSLMIAVNSTYAGDELQIKASDEVVLIPPVSGG